MGHVDGSLVSDGSASVDSSDALVRAKSSVALSWTHTTVFITYDSPGPS